MSWIGIWIHLVFSTKNREPFLQEDFRQSVFHHMKLNAEKKGIYLDSVDGYIDHCHCLISMNKEQSISKIAQLLKGESSHWINNQKLGYNEFNWQDDYWAVSVSQNHLKALRHYIWSQEKHHQKELFETEINRLIIKHGFQLISDKT